MNATTLAWVALAGGIATFAIRLLPMLASERLQDRPLPPRLRRFLLALGPSSIAAMLALSVTDLLPADRLSATLPAVTAGLAAVWLTHRWSGNAARATLAGTLAYGVVAALAGM
ncbi:MAG: Membrane protein [Stygiobacter sp.]|nr:MAG: Membrane protein [Stygiobacter sp.]